MLRKHNVTYQWGVARCLKKRILAHQPRDVGVLVHHFALQMTCKTLNICIFRKKGIKWNLTVFKIAQNQLR